MHYDNCYYLYIRMPRLTAISSKPVCSIPFSRQNLIQILDKITGSGRLLVKIASRCVHLSAFTA